MLQTDIDNPGEPTKVWHGEYRGVTWEVNNFPMPENGRVFDQWCFYLLLAQGMFPPERWPEIWLPPLIDEIGGRTMYRQNRGILGEIEWHGDCSFYQKRGGIDGKSQWVKAGCDYHHLSDVENEAGQTLWNVLCDVKRAIDSLRELIPDLRRCCWKTGKWYVEADGTFENGEFLSNEGREREV